MLPAVVKNLLTQLDLLYFQDNGNEAVNKLSSLLNNTKGVLQNIDGLKTSINDISAKMTASNNNFKQAFIGVPCDAIPDCPVVKVCLIYLICFIFIRYILITLNENGFISISE